MDAQEQIARFKQFFQNNYHTDILENARKGLNYLVLDFCLLSKEDIELADELLNDPEETIKAAEVAIEQFDLTDESKDFQIQIKNTSPSCHKKIADKRIKDLKKLVTFEGVIRSKSKIYGQTKSIKFEYPSCGNIIPVLQNEKKIKQPTRCGCGRKGKFKVLEKNKIDAQYIEVEELPENVDGRSQPKTIRVVLKRWLVDPKFESKFNPGAKVSVTGALFEVPILLRTGGESVDSDYMLDAVHIENIESEEIDLKISDDEMKSIKEIAESDKCLDILKQALAPSLHGMDKIKEGVLIQLAGGVRKIHADGTVKRGDIHILIIGDPGSGKSALLQRIEKILPHARVANGKGASGVGLTASVIKDEYVGWTFQAGTLVLAHKNIAIIDEFDKMSSDDRDSIHEALEQQSVTISKAGVQARLSCECSLIAGANPKYGRFSNYSKILDEINLPPTIVNRFDLIYPVRDIAEPTKDEKLATTILNVHRNIKTNENTLDTAFLRKYLNLVKTYTPMITEKASKKLVHHYLQLRNNAANNQHNKPVPISARQLEGLIRMSEAYAKIRLSNKVEGKDAINAISLMDHCLRQVAFDEETQSIDIDQIATGISSNERSNVAIIKQIMNDLKDQHGKSIPIDQIIIAAENKKLSDKQVDQAIKKMKKMGDAFEPKRGFIHRL